MIKQLPLSFRSTVKNDVRSQFAALCYRIKLDKPQILLVTSRRTRRWIVPKGWPEDGMTPADCALKEAWEEAGVQGKAQNVCLGLYAYAKLLTDNVSFPCVALVYPVKVKSLSKHYPEKTQRQRRWMTSKKASKCVSEPELARIINDFDPKMLR